LYLDTKFIGVLTPNGGKTSPFYKYKEQQAIEDIRSIKNTINLSFYHFYLLPLQILTFLILICCSSLVTMAFLDALGGMPILEQFKVRLPDGVPLGGHLLDPYRAAPMRPIRLVHHTSLTSWCSGVAWCAPTCCMFSARYLARHVFASTTS